MTTVDVTGWALAGLIVMAVALAAMAAGQVILAVMVARMSRQTIETVQQFRRELQPTVEKMRQVADDASKLSALAVVQAERIDQVVAATAQRIDETLTAVQDSIIGPLRQGSAVIAGLRAAIEVLRTVSERRRTAREEEDALFIG